VVALDQGQEAGVTTATRPWPDQLWPASLWVVRHGESSGNVARDKAEAEGLERIDIAERDVDVPLSDLGREQAQALGRWTARQPEEQQPTVLWVSPYLRAQQTAQIALQAAGLDVPTVVDERLREREFGVLDGLTRKGIWRSSPTSRSARAGLGKFYHRPPGGESWSDVLLRPAAALDDMRRETPGERVLLVAHQVVVLLVRYVVEGLDEKGILAIDAEGRRRQLLGPPAPLTRRDRAWSSLRYNETTALEEQDAEVTDEPDVPGAPRLTPPVPRRSPRSCCARGSCPSPTTGGDKHERGTVLVVGGATSTPERACSRAAACASVPDRLQVVDRRADGRRAVA
jgi:broad specificity phosphatase PhoE